MRAIISAFVAIIMIAGLTTHAGAQTLIVTPEVLSASLKNKGMITEIIDRDGEAYIRYSFPDWPAYYLFFNDCDAARVCKNLLFYSQEESPTPESADEVKEDMQAWTTSEYVTNALKGWPNRKLNVMAELSADNRLTIAMSTHTGRQSD